MTRLNAMFERTRARGEVALLPYLTAGFPDRSTSPALLQAILRGGADGMEIGIPFSDPMADGLTLQKANQRALDDGATTDTAFELAAGVRRLSADAPIVLMGYYNSILAPGLDRFCGAAADAGADALVVPDLPPEECAQLRNACLANGQAYVLMLAPTSTPERIRLVAELAGGFIYCVALAGVTGARASLSSAVGPFLSRVREATGTPLVVGFGISQPEHVRALQGQADGAIVASALADLAERTPAADRANAIAKRVQELKLASLPATAGSI